MTSKLLRCPHLHGVAFRGAPTRLFRGGRASATLVAQTAVASNVLTLTRSVGRRARKAFIGQRKPPRMQSLFGVGAPEAILVGVVALVVFGPKGLAEAARTVGKLLRSFQPTIQEVVEVSRDLQSTLKQELGIDELQAAARGNTVTPTPKPAPLSQSVPTELKAVDEETAKLVDPDIEAKRAAAAAAAWGATPPAAPPAEAPPAAPAAKDLQQLSMEELEAELARRRAASAAKTTDAAPKA